MNVIRFTVPGRAVAAVRMTQRDKWKPAAQKYLSYKDAVGWYAKRATAGEKLLDDIKVNLILYMIKGRRGDIDNLCKSLLDGCNDICYKDDRQIVRLTAEIVRVKKVNEQRAEVQIQPA